MNGALPKTYWAPSNSLLNSTELTCKRLILNQSHYALGHCTFEGGVMSWFIPRLPMSFQSLVYTPNVSKPLQIASEHFRSVSNPPGSLAYFLFYLMDSYMSLNSFFT